MPKLKAAAVSFLNAWPLTEGLERSDRIELVQAEPSRCAAQRFVRIDANHPA